MVWRVRMMYNMMTSDELDLIDLRLKMVDWVRKLSKAFVFEAKSLGLATISSPSVEGKTSIAQYIIPELLKRDVNCLSTTSSKESVVNVGTMWHPYP